MSPTESEQMEALMADGQTTPMIQRRILRDAAEVLTAPNMHPVLLAKAHDATLAVLDAIDQIAEERAAEPEKLSGYSASEMQRLRRLPQHADHMLHTVFSRTETVLADHTAQHELVRVALETGASALRQHQQVHCSGYESLPAYQALFRKRLAAFVPD